MALEYEELELKAPRNKVVWNIAITGKNKNKSETPYMPRVFWNNGTGFTDEPVVQCDVPAVIKTSLDDDINDDRK